MRGISKWLLALKLKRISTIAIIITTMLSATIAGVTIYANNVGNFIISIQKDTELGLSLFDNKELRDPTSMLSAGGIKDITNATLANIPSNIANIDGSHNDLVSKRYLAYTFYLKNTSAIAVNYEMEFKINKTSKNVDAALRVMILTDDTREIYAKAKADGTPEDYPYITTMFASPTTVFRLTITNFAYESVEKYTVVLWLEGYDEQCVDSIKGGIIRSELKFTAL